MTIEVTGVKELMRKLGRAGGLQVLQKPMERGVDRLWTDIAVNPPPPAPGAWAAWVRSHGEPKASQIRGAFFASGWTARTGSTKRWTRKIRRTGGGLQGVIGNNSKAAPWLYSHKFQAGFHKGRWPTDKEVVDRNRRAIVRDFQRAIDKALRD